MDRDCIRKLAQAHLDGRLSDEEFDLLRRVLQNDAVARSEYAKLARLDSELREHSEVGAIGPDQVISFPSSRLRWTPGIRMVAAAAAIIALLVPVWLATQSGKQNGEREVTASPLIARGVAVISAQAGAIWGESTTGLIAEGVALEPGRLVLLEGLAQIDFFGGASVSLSGPAEIELISGDSAVLHRGRIRADVPPAARGFEIHTAEVRIEDLGTSFGLAVSDDASAEIVVFDGEVRAIRRDGEALSLFGGDTARLSRGTASLQAEVPKGDFPNIGQIIAGADDRDESRYAAWKKASLERRNDPRLIAYYDFEDLSETSRRLENRASLGTGSELDGGIVGSRVTQGRWAQKTALDFRREGDRVRFQIPGEFDAITLYVWVRIDALDRQLNSLFLTDSFDPNEIHWQVSRAGRMHFATSPMGVEDIATHNRRFYSEPIWDSGMSGQWIMLATTADRGDGTKAGTVTHYCNGRKVKIDDGTQMHKPLPGMRIGRADLGNWSDPIWTTAIRTLNGRVDEFALYHAVLPAAELEQIYRQGKP